MTIQSRKYSMCWVPSLAALLSSCDLISPGDCVNVGVPGLNVTVVDPRSNQTPPGTVVVANDGEYRETLQAPFGDFLGATERPGTYTVTVEAPGYARWIRENVQVVRRGKCDGIVGVKLRSELQPSGTI